MKNIIKNQYLKLLRNQGNKAGIVPVENPANEDERLAEVKRLGIMDLDLSGERRYNSITQVATYLTGCNQSSINILGSSVQVPITDGSLNLGTWQGIYLCEHRNYSVPRTLVLTAWGEEYQ